MNILFIATYEGMSGASYSLLGMIEELCQMGVEPCVVLLKNGKMQAELKERGIPFCTVRGYPWVVASSKRKKLKERLFWTLKRLYNAKAENDICKIIKEKNIDIVHINAFTASVGFIAAKKMQVPIVWHIREFVEEDLGKLFWNKKKALKRLEQADRVIAISESVGNKYRRLAPDAKIQVIYNGIPTDKYNDGRRTPAFSEVSISAILAGRIDPGKGHEEVIEALSEIGADNLSNFQLNIAGISQSKEFEEKIRKLVSDSGLEKNVHFLGFRTDLPEIYKNSDIAIVSSKAEAFGRVTVEAMMGGTLVVGADTAGTKEIIGERYGVLYKQGDSHDLAEKLKFILANKEKYCDVAKCGQKYALHTFTAKRNAENVLKIYSQLKLVDRGETRAIYKKLE